MHILFHLVYIFLCHKFYNISGHNARDLVNLQKNSDGIGEIIMAERRYLKWYNKVGYGSGDIAGNVVYAFLSSFVMIYLTNTVGLNPGIVGTLIAFSKLLDGVTDIFFGSLIDKTHSKMGKARPWMLYGYIGCAITLVAILQFLRTSVSLHSMHGS